MAEPLTDEAGEEYLEKTPGDKHQKMPHTTA